MNIVKQVPPFWHGFFVHGLVVVVVVVVVVVNGLNTIKPLLAIWHSAHGDASWDFVQFWP